MAIRDWELPRPFAVELQESCAAETFIGLDSCQASSPERLKVSLGGKQTVHDRLTRCYYGCLRINLDFCRHDLDGELDHVAGQLLARADDIWCAHFDFKPPPPSEAADLNLDDQQRYRFHSAGALHRDGAAHRMRCAQAFQHGAERRAEKRRAHLDNWEKEADLCPRRSGAMAVAEE